MNKFLTNLLSYLKKIGNILLKIFKWMFSKVERIIIVMLIIITIVLLFKYSSIQHKYDNLTIDYINSQDSVLVYKNKSGELYSMVQGYVTDNKTLKEKNEELYKEVKNLKDNPVVVTKTDIIYKIDTLQMKTDTVYIDSTNYVSYFSYNDEWCNITGHNILNIESCTNKTILDSLNMQSSLYVDLIEKDKQLMFIAKVNNPYLQINNIEGAMVSPEKSKVLKKRFNKPWGIMIGVGPSVTVTNNTVKVYPAIQLTLGYQIISF